MRTMDVRSHSGNTLALTAVLRTKTGRERANRHLADEKSRLEWLSLLTMYWTSKE
jgi:hypothetical protein